MKHLVLLIFIVEIISACSRLESYTLNEYDNTFLLPKMSFSNPMETCRHSKGYYYLHPEVFFLYSCAWCYLFIDEKLFDPGEKLNKSYSGIHLNDARINEDYLANSSDPSNPIWKSLKTPKVRQLWSQCCEAAKNCCNQMRKPPFSNELDYCPRTWDGWSCWPDTPKNTIASARCPNHAYMFSDAPFCQRFATKTCLANATWYRNEKNNEWSNYTTCSQKDDIQDILISHTITFAISIIVLLPALVILFYYKQLQIFRISIHKGLFLSLLANGIFVIIFENYFMKDSLNKKQISLVQENGVFCKIVYVITKYFRLSTYMWMLCEGLYLHKLIAAAFSKQKSLVIFYLIGWGSPLIPVGIWATLRQINEASNKNCWTISYNFYEYILFAPMFLALGVNLLFFVNIIRILYTQLKSNRAKETTQFRRAFKGTIMLMPLFGLHFILLMYHPEDVSCITRHVYKIMTYCVDGLQGALVAIIFCYCNNDVILHLQNSYKRRRLIKSVESQAMSSGKKSGRKGSRVSVSTMASTLTNYTDRKTAV